MNNYDEKLINVDSPLAKDSGLVTGFTADSTFERGLINSMKLKDRSITSNKLETGAIGTGAIADNTITSSMIIGSAVTSSKINGQAITTGKIAGSAVTAEKISLNAVTNDKINDYDFAKGTGNVGTMGTVRAISEFNANGSVGIGTTITILDRNVAVGTITHTMIFKYGLLVSYGTA
jgi:hypothetical protein